MCYTSYMYNTYFEGSSLSSTRTHTSHHATPCHTSLATAGAYFYLTFFFLKDHLVTLTLTH
jgi:hypothetical protein